MKVVDTHAHFLPSDMVARVRSDHQPDGTTVEVRDGASWVVHRQGFAYPLEPHFHDVGARLRHMTENGITHAVLSVPPTFFFYWAPAAEAIDAAGQLNDSLAQAAAAGQGRLSAVATLPMQDVDAAVRELRRAVLELGLKGAEIGPSVEGQPLDGPAGEAVLSTAAELDVPLIIHPYYVGSDPVLHDFYMTNLLGNPWQTTLCATRLILSGTLDRLPKLRILLVHGGGYLPTAIGRLDHGARVRPELAQFSGDPSDYLRRFHYDTLTHDPTGLRHLIDQVGPDRIVFGSDTPFDMGTACLDGQLGSEPLPSTTREALSYANAEALFSWDNADD